MSERTPGAKAERYFFFGVVAAFLLSLCVPSVWGQAVATGTITGTVTDNTGAIVAGATVTLIDKATGDTRTTTTNDVGHYIFQNANPSSYTLKFKKPGFAELEIANVVVQVGTQLTENAQLKLGAVSTTVTVTETAGAELQTMNATVGNTVNGIELNSLPSISRDASTFVELQPGVTPEGSVAGVIFDQNSFQLDGGQNTNDMDGSMNIYTPSFAGDPTGGLVSPMFTGTGGGGPTGVMPTPIDSIEEFKANTTNQTADFNSSAGAEISMVTKRGTNSWHGTVYDYYLDNTLDANTYDNNYSGVKIPDYHYSRFGVAGGGPIIPKEILGGKTYFFANYQGWRFPNSTTITRLVPSAGMKLGLLQFGGTVYNLNPGPTLYPSSAPADGILVPGTTYAGSGTTLDPRGLGISSAITQLWSVEPPSNTASCFGQELCDGLNVQAFRGNVGIPQNDNFGVARLDHDFGSKWHFISSYRDYRLIRATTSQIDIANGAVKSLSARPQQPWFLVAGLTTNLTPNTTNDFHYNYLRNYWQWGDLGAVPQFSGLGAALEPFGESATEALTPYNVNTQSIRTRFWDGQDNTIRDDVSILHGNHLFQVGGTYEHNWNYHQRTDNGGGIDYFPVYQLAAGINMAGYIPSGVTAGKPTTRWENDYAAVLGITSVTQVAYTRSGPSLTLNPPLTPAYDQSTIPFYNVYFSDSWHMKPTFTLTYGLGWTLEMPPTEANGKQVELVDSSGQQLDTIAYLKQRERAALQGQVYNPEVGFALVGNTGKGQKYPYNPFYGSFSPRIAAAWNPNFDTGALGTLFGHGKSVLRGGFSIIYGRLNGVDLVLVPLLGTGLIQPVQCFGANMNGTCGAGGSTNPTNAFRVGPDGLVAPIPTPSQTLPQPDFPGFNAVAAGAGEALDPNFKPNRSYQFDLTLQRQFSNKITLELGYIGRKFTDDYQPININTVPYMMTVGGQRFDKAYANLVMEYCGGNVGLVGGNCAANASAVTPQPFFETAMAGTGYCTGFSSCTAAVAANEGVNGTGNLNTQNVWSLYSDLDNGGYNFARSMMNTPIPGSALGGQGQLSSGVGVNGSFGWGNYNAGFITLKTNDWHGLTALSNFTYARALGTGAEVQATSEFTTVDPFNIGHSYGTQSYDRKFDFNALMVYQPPFFTRQQGALGRVLGGWSFSPILTAGSGLPLFVYTTSFNPNVGFGGQSYGEADAIDFGSLEQGVNVCSNTHFGSTRINQPVGGGFGANGFVNAAGTTAPGLYSNPGAVYNCFRNPVLGLDEGPTGGGGQLRGQPFYNVDFQVRKNILITERYSFEFQAVFTNVLNHNQFFDPFLQVGDAADWGALEAEAGTPRQMELGLRFRF